MVLHDRGGICSGVVIAPDVVLTAAHCVPAGAAVRVHFREGGQPVLLQTQALRRHPEYRANAVQERKRSIDLALIRTESPLPQRFVPATLSTGRIPAATAVVAAGYGLAREGDAATTGSWRSVPLRTIEPYGPSTVLLWAKGTAGSGACQGDSGGPITDARQTVVAVTTWSTGRDGQACGDLTQGALVGAQRSWIDSVLTSWGKAAAWN